MTRPLLPPRGIFIPTQIIFHPQLPSAVIVTWIKLRCLAWTGWVTPPLSIAELASLTSIHPARLYRHLSHLQDISSLSMRSVGDGKIIVSFPDEPAVEPENHAEHRNLAGAAKDSSMVRELPDPHSYFPPRILGYLSFQDDHEDILIFKGSPVPYEEQGDAQTTCEEGIHVPISQDFEFYQPAEQPT